MKKLLVLAALLFFGIAAAQDETTTTTKTTRKHRSETVKKNSAAADSARVAAPIFANDSIDPIDPIRAKPGDPEPEKMKKIRVKEQTQTN